MKSFTLDGTFKVEMILYILYSSILFFGKVSSFPHNGPASSYEDADSKFLNGDHTFLDDHNWKLELYLGDYYVPKINGEPIYLPPSVSHSQNAVLKPENEKSPKGSLLSVYDNYVQQALSLEPTPDEKIGFYSKPIAQPIKDSYNYLPSSEGTLNSIDKKAIDDAFDQGSAMDPFAKENKEVNEVYADYDYAKKQDKQEAKENQEYENYEYKSSYDKVEKKTKQQDKTDKHSDKVAKGKEEYDVYNYSVEKEDKEEAKQQDKEDKEEAKQQDKEDKEEAKQQDKEDKEEAKHRDKEDKEEAKQQDTEDKEEAKQQDKEDKEEVKQQHKEDKEEAKQQHKEDKEEAKQQQDYKQSSNEHDKTTSDLETVSFHHTDANFNRDSHSLSGTLDSSLRSLAFHPKVQTVQRFQRCVTRSNETGVCMSIQHCSVPNVANSLEQWMNNVCVIEEAFIGVCCPEFPVESVKVEWDEAFEQVSNLELSRSDFKDCGLKQDNPSSWPWLAPLLSLSTGNIFCGGVLITDLYVLTAAHCTTKIPNNQILVRLGQHDISDPEDTSGEDFTVVEIKRHAQYDRRTLQNDVALLKLSRRVPFDQFKGTVCLPNKSNYVGNEATLIGWKGIFGDSVEGRLLEETLIVMPNDECEDIQGFNVPDSQLCTEHRDETRTCNADSGAPLVLKVGNKYEVIGVLSWDRNDCDARFPSVFTLVSYYNDWIKKHVQDY